MLNNAYKYILAIEKHRNITKAAAELYITQPALTKYLNRLEAELGVKLFERTPALVTPTVAGRLFLEKAKEIAAMENTLLQHIHNVAQNISGTLSLGITTEFASVLLPHVLPDFVSTYPGVQINIEENSNTILISKVRHQEIEMAIIPSPFVEPGCAFLPLIEDPVILIMPASHPIAQTFDLTTNSPYTPYYLEPGRVNHADFIICPPSLGIGAVTEELFKRHHIDPRIILKLGQNKTAVKLVSCGMGMTFAPVRTPLRIALQGPLAYFSLDAPMFVRHRGIFYREDRPLSGPAKIFAEMLRQAVTTAPEFRPPICQLIFQPSN